MPLAPELSRRGLIAALTAAGAAALLAAAPMAARAQEIVSEMAIGDPNAPVTVVEYASFTCPHCAAFHQSVLPQLKADYVDTGKVRLVYREVYFDKPALWASMVARCAGEDRFFGVADLLFKNQAAWSRAADAPTMIAQLSSIGRQAGMTDAEVNACLGDATLAQNLVTWFQTNATADGIDATPTFIIDGEKFPNAPYPEMKAKIEEKLAS